MSAATLFSHPRHGNKKMVLLARPIQQKKAAP
jgi:hypothetical protein